MGDGHHHPLPTSSLEDRVNALESVLIDKGILDVASLDGVIDYLEHSVGPMIGAKVIARAWVDPLFKQRLLADGTSAVSELRKEWLRNQTSNVVEDAFAGPDGDHLVVVENTPSVHNVIVCTLCSCYPWQLLGLPPNWYKSAPYRSRVVREPRVLLSEMGCPIAADVEIAVWDSSAEVRYLVLPMPPDDVGEMTEDDLSALVTRDSMIGVAVL